MNRLWVRLMLAFVAVTLVAVSIVAVLADWSANAVFRQYLARQDVIAQSGVVNDLVEYYRQHGTWDGLVLTSVGGYGRGQARARPALIVTDARYRVVYDERGERVGAALASDERASSQPIVADGQTIGYWLVSRAGQGLSSSEENFLNQLRATFALAAILASGLGILVGGWMSRTLAAPLANLARAARLFAARDWHHRVEVAGADEIATVAREFNAMADELARAETLRRNLMADVAHELRTPLTVLQGNLRALLDDVYPLDRAEIATLYDQTRLLSRLVDDLRELALADAGQLPLNLQPTDLAPIIQATVANFAPAAEAQKVRLHVEPLDNLPRVNADADRVAQVLGNLIANALRHTPAGGIVGVQCAVNGEQRTVDGGQTTSLRVTVSDSGGGIAPEELPRVFDRFYRGAASRARGGTGLGLAIVKAWVEAMGGQVGATSDLGRGSRFWFTLPIAPA